MKEIVNRLQENRQIQLAKEILESNGYKVTLNTLKESTIPLSDDIGRWSDFTDPDRGYSEEEIEQYREEYEDIADALGTTIDNLLCCTEDTGVDTFEFFQEAEYEKVKDLLNVMGVHRGLYQLEDGTQFVLNAEFGYGTYYFVDPSKSNSRPGKFKESSDSRKACE